MCNLINTHTHKHKHTHTVSLIPPWEDQREWHRMTRMTRPDCAVMCNLINTHTHTHTHKHTHTDASNSRPERVRYARISDRYFSLFHQEMMKGGIAVTDGLLSRPETGVNQSLSQPTKCIPTHAAQAPELTKLQAASYVGVR